MTILSEEIARIVELRIAQHTSELEVKSTGSVISVGDGIARVYGLRDCMASELLEFESGLHGMAMSLEPEIVGVILFGDDSSVKEGDLVRCTGRVMEMPVGPELIGRIVNPLGIPLDNRGDLGARCMRLVEERAPGVVDRQPVTQPLHTGVKAVDAMIPIGRGQRELIIGDRGTGKTSLALDTILSQKGHDVMCIYVAVGQKQSSVARVHRILKNHGAMDYTVIVSASASDPAPLQYLAPFSGTAIGEHIRDQGGHALIIYDDLTKHAFAYRQLSLLLRRPPGREAFPGDIFNLHSRLLERSARLCAEKGGGSLTSLPIIETLAGDVSAYIPTNVISITDGQIYLESDLFYAGVRPAINAGISVSRVGGKAQTKAMRQTAGKLRVDLAQYRELAAFAQLGSELDKVALSQISRGQRMVELLKQNEHEPIPLEKQIVSLYAAHQGFYDQTPVEEIRAIDNGWTMYVNREKGEIMKAIREQGELTEALKVQLNSAWEAFANNRTLHGLHS